MKSYLLIILISLLPVVASAYDLAIENNEGVTIYYNFINNNMELEVTSPKLEQAYNYYYTEEVIIPSSVTYKDKCYPVTRIGVGAFYACINLTSVTIPNSVKSIEGSAFSGTGLTSLTIPESVTNIAGYSIYGDNLASIIVEEGNTRFDSRDDCNAIIETKTNSLIVGCMNTNIPNNVNKISDGAFCGCSGLKKISIPNSVTTIGVGSFLACKNLVYISIPESVTDIGSYAFKNCSSLPSITIPNSITSIRKQAFGDCSSLTTAIFGNKVTCIEDGAFCNCFSLTSITIPQSVTSIGKRVFEECWRLTVVYCFADDVPETISDAFYNSSFVSATLHVPVNSVDLYKATSPWRYFGDIVPITEDDITPINSISNGNLRNSTSVYYDLNGRPTQHPAKGVYIKNNRKIAIK